MIVPDAVRKCVAFIGYQMVDGTYRLAGTAFYLGRSEPGSTVASPVYLVTARHVIDEIRAKGVETVQVRLNLNSGALGWLPIPLEQWFAHPTDKTLDVAITKTGVPDGCDHLVIAFEMGVTEQVEKENEVGLGDEVFIVGLFRHHHGTRRNIPIVRVGNLAANGEETVTTALGDMDAILIEARSIGGLSGSPTFLNLGITRMIGGAVKHARGSPFYWLLGLVHGHFDAETGAIDAADATAAGTIKHVNTGIAIVVPFRKIEELVRLLEAAG